MLDYQSLEIDLASMRVMHWAPPWLEMDLVSWMDYHSSGV